jgi:dephospho-CoA kinase
MLLGLAGLYCAGKSTVAELLAARGWALVDADALGHEAVDLAGDAIARRFGPGVLGADGRVDRRAVARIVFSDPAALADQEAIIHPIAVRLAREKVAEAEIEARAAGREPRTCVHAALLHRAGMTADFDAILFVEAPFLLRLARGSRRDREGLHGALRRMRRQKGFREALLAQAREAGVPLLALRNSCGRGALEAALSEALASEPCLPRLSVVS